jgi:putative RecB family exonuclease
LNQYSHSRLSSFENCPRQFRYRYIEKIESDDEGIEAFVGKRVHEILERLYHHVSRHGRPPSLAQVHERFSKDWLLHFHERVHIVKRENDVEYYQQVGLRCLENYYRSHYPFEEGQTIGIEHPISLKLDTEGRYQIRGIVDRIVRRRPGSYEIHDYKTSGSLPPRKRIEADRQLALYQIGLEQSYDDVEEVSLVWHYLVFDRTLTSKRTPEQLQKLRSGTIKLIDKIESATEHPARPGPLCRWCDYRTLCPDARADARPASQGPAGPEPPLPGAAPGLASEPPREERKEPSGPQEPEQLSLL